MTGPIKNIIFAGGGFKGWAYIGTIRALNEYIKLSDIEEVIGVSIGSVFGLMYLLDIKWDYLLDFLMNLNFKDIIDIDIDNILVNQSIINGDLYTQFIKEIIATKIDPEVTFMELYRFSKIKYTVNALNINDSKIEYFNYQLTPNIKIIDAIKASSSLPFLFPPAVINGKYYYDGGLCNNCPVNLVDELGTIAFDVNTIRSNCSSIKLVDLIMSLISISHKAIQTSSEEVIYTILDSRFNNEVVNINQTKDDIFNIYMIGYINSKNVIYDNFFAIKNKM
jgi:predicted acylesterase/phospholipase RssA